jgi:hypothetical protein
VNTTNDTVAGKSLIGLLIGLRNKTNERFQKAKARDRSHHARLTNAKRAFNIALIQLTNAAMILAGVIIGAMLFVSPFGRWITMQDAIVVHSEIALHCLFGIVALAFVVLGASRMRDVGTIGPVGRFLSWEYYRVTNWMQNGHTLNASLEFLSVLDYPSDEQLVELWKKYVYVSLVSFAGEIVKDERKHGGSSRGFLERAFTKQLKVAIYFGVGSDTRSLRQEVFSETNGTRQPRYV